MSIQELQDTFLSEHAETCQPTYGAYFLNHHQLGPKRLRSDPKNSMVPVSLPQLIAIEGKKKKFRQATTAPVMSNVVTDHRYSTESPAGRLPLCTIAVSRIDSLPESVISCSQLEHNPHCRPETLYVTNRHHVNRMHTDHIPLCKHFNTLVTCFP